MEICRFSTYASLVAQWEKQVVWLTVQYLTLNKKKRQRGEQGAAGKINRKIKCLTTAKLLCFVVY